MSGMLSDVTGIGSVFGAISQGTSECGSRPICVGGGLGCEEKQRLYNACLQKNIDSKTVQSKNKTVIIVVGIVAAVIILALILKRKR